MSEWKKAYKALKDNPKTKQLAKNKQLENSTYKNELKTEVDLYKDIVRKAWTVYNQDGEYIEFIGAVITSYANRLGQELEYEPPNAGKK